MSVKSVKKIGITGIGGFIGSFVERALAEEGHCTVSLDKYTRSSVNNADLFNDLDWVLHFAAHTSIKDSIENPFNTYAENLTSTLTALKIANLSNAAFLFMSSYVYGVPEYLPIDEKHSINALNPYMGSKIAGETVCSQLSKLLNIPLVILRGFNIYGDNKIDGRLISDLLKAVSLKEPMVVNDPVPKRDYLYIKDFTMLIKKIVSQNPVKVGVFNAGYGESFSNYEVAEMIREVSKSKVSINVKSDPRPNDILECIADINLVKKTFSWAPIYTLHKGLSELLGIIK